MAGVAEKFQCQKRAHRMPGRDHLRTGKTGLFHDLIEGEGGQVGKKEKQAAELRAESPRLKVKLLHIGYRGRLGFRPCGGAFLIPTTGQAGEAFLLKNHSHPRRAQLLIEGLQGLADVINREILFPESNDLLPHPIRFRGFLRPLTGRQKKRLLGVLPKLVAEHSETPRSIVETLGDLGGGKLVHKIGAEGLVLSVGSVLGLKKESGQGSFLPSLIDILPLYQICLSCQGKNHS